jgi:predicted alpha/beta superfamily hydrolase
MFNFFKQICLSVMMVVTCSVSAQYAAPLRDSIISSVLHEQRDLLITLPTNYSSDTAHYDVWFVLDGEWDRTLFTQIFTYMVNMQFAPPAIIVAVPNRYVNGFNLRDRDLTPTKIVDIDSSGGAVNYLAFFEKELMPYINQKFRTSGESGLFGGSLGGLFTLYALLTKPSQFRFYAVADPALHNDGQQIPRLAAARLPEINFSNTVLHIGGRGEANSYHVMARDMMDSVLKTAAPSGLHWQSDLYPNETHGSTMYKSQYDGLKYAYLGYYVRNVRCYPCNGIVLKDHPVRLFVSTDYSDIRYTLDGSMPTRTSKKMDDHLIIGEPEKLKIFSFSPSGRYDHDITVKLRSGDYLVSKKSRTTSKQEKQLSGAFKDNGSNVMEGWVGVDNDGYYVMQLSAPKGTCLFFNDSLLVRADQQTNEEIILPLRKGKYLLRLKRPANGMQETPFRFGMFYNKGGQADWWMYPLVKW